MKKMAKKVIKEEKCKKKAESSDEDDISEEDDYQDLRASTRTQFQEAEAATEY